MQNELLRFLPKFVQWRLADSPLVPEVSVSEAWSAAVLFADVSGFTPLALHLAEMGPEGAERLDEVLNEYYGQLVEIIDLHGGDIVAFAGDAAICTWREPQDGQYSVIAACDCALAIQKKLNRYRVGNDLELSLRVCIGFGKVTEANVGGLNGQWRPLVVGEAFDQLAQAESQTEIGEVVLSPAAAQRAAREVVGVALNNGSLKLKKVRRENPILGPATETFPPGSEAAFRSFIPQFVLERLDAGQGNWLADLRSLTVLFFKLVGVSASDERRAAQLQEAMRCFQASMQRFEGDVVHFLQDDKGIIAVLCFGLPPHIHEDDPLRAIRAAKELESKLGEIGLQSNIGIASGRVFSGIRGSERRCEYSVTGHVVNLAARIMSVSPGQIGCDVATRRSVREGASFDRSKTFDLKGLADPVTVYFPELATLGQGAAQEQFVGREQELRAITGWLSSTNGEANVFLIEGDAGIGKSMLLAELVTRADQQQLRVVQSDCDSIERSTAFFAWRTLMEELFAIGGITDKSARREKILEFLGAEKESQERAALLNPFLDCEFEESNLISQLSSEARAGVTQDFILQVVANNVEAQKLILVIDDVQWLDSASWQLLSAIATRLKNVLIALAARPLGDTERIDGQRILKSENTQILHLGNLDREAVGKLIRKQVRTEKIQDNLISFLFERSDGNPFFIRELLHFLRESELLSQAGEELGLSPQFVASVAEGDVPTSLRALITNRVDRLEHPQQMTIKTASVVGRSFAKRTLLAVYEVEEDRKQLGDYLHNIAKMRLIQVEKLEPDESYLFQHLAVQQVVYDQIPLRNRKQLHALIADWFEKSHAENAAFFPLLAYHWGNAAVPTKEVEYLAKAGNEALLRFANREAAQFFRDAVDKNASLDVAQQVPDRTLGHWNRLLGEAEFHLGDLSTAQQRLEQALMKFGWQPNSTKWANLRRFVFEAARQVVHRLLPSLTVNQTIVPEENAASGGAHEAALAVQQLSQIHYLQVDMALGVSRAVRALNLAERAGKSPLLARAYSGMCLVTGILRMHPVAKRYGLLSEKAAKELQHLPTLSYVLMATGVYRLGVAQWELVRENALQSIEIARRIGDLRLLGDTLAVEAMRCCLLGDHRGGERVYEEIGTVAQRSENVVHQAWRDSGVGECLFRRGELAAALECFANALELLGETEHMTEEIRMHAFVAVTRWRLGQTDAALEEAKCALDIVRGASYATVSTLEGFAAIAEVYLRAFEQNPDDTAVQNCAKEACDSLTLYAKRFPVGQSRAACFQALWFKLNGRDAKAMRLWRSSISLARRYQLPYDEPWARLCLGTWGAIEPSARSEQLHLASRAFARLGCAYEQQCADTELTKLD